MIALNTVYNAWADCMDEKQVASFAQASAQAHKSAW